MIIYLHISGIKNEKNLRKTNEFHDKRHNNLQTTFNVLFPSVLAIPHTNSSIESWNHILIFSGLSPRVFSNATGIITRILEPVSLNDVEILLICK